MDKHHRVKTRVKLAQTEKLPPKANSIAPLRLPSFMDFVEDFLVALERDGRSALTIQSYRYHLKWFWHFLVDNSLPQELGEITESHASKYIVARRRNKAENSTLAVLVSVLRSFFGWCLRQDFIDVNPMARIQKPSPDKKAMQIFSAEQVVQMIEAWPARTMMGERNRTILLLLYDTGLRVGELITLTTDAVDLKLREILVEHGKGRKQRIVGMSEKTRGQLYRWMTQYREGWASDSPYLFTNSKGKQLTRRDAWVLLSTSGKKAGIEGVRCSPHTLRHSFATGMATEVDVRDLQELLGHSNIQTTMLYVHPHPKQVAERHKRKALGDKLKVKLR